MGSSNFGGQQNKKARLSEHSEDGDDEDEVVAHLREETVRLPSSSRPTGAMESSSSILPNSGSSTEAGILDLVAARDGPSSELAVLQLKCPDCEASGYKFGGNHDTFRCETAITRLIASGH